MKTNTSTSVWMALCLAIFFGCDGCPSGAGCDTSQYGTANCECRTTGNGCNSGLACDDGICRSCGNTGNICCVSGGSGICNGTLMCVSESEGEFCRNCGDPGESCCQSSGASMCNAGALCMSGSCVSVASISCNPNGTIFRVGIQDANMCGVRVVEVRASSAADAVACAGSSGMLNAGESVYPTPNTPLVDFELCVETAGSGRQTTSVQAFDDFGAQRCARWTRCGTAGCLSVTPGACM